MKKQVKDTLELVFEIWKQPRIKWIVGISILLLAIVFAIPFLKLYPEIQLRTAVPLHYNIHFGVDLFGAWWRVFMPAIIGLAIIVVNCILAVIFWKKNKVLTFYSLITTPVLMVFLILASVFITLLNLIYD